MLPADSPDIPITLSTGIGPLNAVAIDAGGDLFIADATSGIVQERPATGGALHTLGSFSGPYALALDHAGNLFVGDAVASSVTELTAASHFASAVPVTAGLGQPSSVAVDTK